MATTEEIQFLFSGTTKADADEFDEIFESVRTDKNADQFFSSVVPQTTFGPEQQEADNPGSTGSAPIAGNPAFKNLAQLFMREPVIPAPPGGTNVGGASQTNLVRTPNFQAPALQQLAQLIARR
jgi:hypothetical protein